MFDTCSTTRKQSPRCEVWTREHSSPSPFMHQMTPDSRQIARRSTDPGLHSRSPLGAAQEARQAEGFSGRRGVYVVDELFSAMREKIWLGASAAMPFLDGESRE
jgi:hypothetical protein